MLLTLTFLTLTPLIGTPGPCGTTFLVRIGRTTKWSSLSPSFSYHATLCISPNPSHLQDQVSTSSSVRVLRCWYAVMCCYQVFHIMCSIHSADIMFWYHVFTSCVHIFVFMSVFHILYVHIILVCSYHVFVWSVDIIMCIYDTSW
jgi:hypothetical protein